ncbi:PREDICTED: 21 kDa protein [Ipomoea nil]|uniref:21 kDa protein n=1 Tax=Ipomoea nil TaxID=35883 RepID=UPI0009009C6B|nr:PREDICTED: 21 kDa protein [Ipomoea nil]
MGLSLRFCLLVQALVLCCTLVAGERRPRHVSTSSPAGDLVRKSCVNASFPGICYRTLSEYSGGAMRTPRDLAQAAVGVSLHRAGKTSVFLRRLKARSRREKAAVSDCVEQMGDTVDELSRSVAELKHLRRGIAFEWQMSNVETWVSAALTNEDTCLDGFKEVEVTVRSDVKRRIRNVARVTSNALYLINQLDTSRHK